MNNIDQKVFEGIEDILKEYQEEKIWKMYIDYMTKYYGTTADTIYIEECAKYTDEGDSYENEQYVSVFTNDGQLLEHLEGLGYETANGFALLPKPVGRNYSFCRSEKGIRYNV